MKFRGVALPDAALSDAVIFFLAPDPFVVS